MIRRFLSTGPALRRAVPVVVVLALLFSAFQVFSGDTKKGVAYFESVTSVYEGDKVRILGVEVGRIDKIVAEDDRVRVEFSYDSRYDVPAEAKAAIVSPTLVSTRFIQLSPAYTGGPTLADGGEIPIERTASPLEFDDLKTELSRLSTTLGPTAADEEGSLARFLDIAATNARGQGQNFHDMVTQLSDALGTLAEGRGDIFGTVRDLQTFVTAVASMNDQVVEFNQRLGDVAGLLDDNGDELATAITRISHAADVVDDFLQINRSALDDSIAQLTDLTGDLAESRDDIATLLHVAPNTLTNLLHVIDWKSGSLVGGLVLDNAMAPGELACAIISAQLANQQAADTSCMQTLGPLLNILSIVPPITINSPVRGAETSSAQFAAPDNGDFTSPGQGTFLPSLKGAN